MIFSELKPGVSVYGKSIEVFKTEVKAKYHLYLIAGTHGDEVEGVYILKRLFEWLKAEHDLEELSIIVIPVLNPDGHEANTRTNARGVDLNRNYPGSDWKDKFEQAKYNPGQGPMSEPENEFLCKLLEKYPPFLVISFHSWKPLVNYNGDSQDIAQFISERNHYELSPDIGYETPGSFGSFLPEKYHAGVITMEYPNFTADKSLKDIWEENEKSLTELFTTDVLQEKARAFSEKIKDEKGK